MNCADRLQNLTHERDVVLDEDLAALQKMSERARIERYNQLKSSEEKFRWEFTDECSDFLTESEQSRVVSDFRLARLLIAASFHAEGNLPAAMADDFIEAELDAVLDFERYKLFDALSESQIEEKIRRMDGEVYELVTEYTSTQIANVDELMDNPDVQQDIVERLLDRYEQRREKIRRGFFVYVETHGLEHMVESIEEAVEAVTDAAKEREQIEAELQSQIDEITDTLDERLHSHQRKIESELDGLESAIESRTIDAQTADSELHRVHEQTADLKSDQDQALSELDDRIDRSVKLEARLKAKIKNLKQTREETSQAERKTAREDAVELIEAELENLREERSELKRQIRRLRRERDTVETARDRLDERQQSLDSRVDDTGPAGDAGTGGVEGDDVVTASVARLLELDYLGRFDISMREAVEIDVGDAAFEVPDGYWEGRSERRNERMRLADMLDDAENPEGYPTNRSSRYRVTNSRYLGLSRETEMIIEARVYSHLQAYASNGFDANPADLDELLSIVDEAVFEAERTDTTYLLGVASPTGWTDRVLEQIQDEEFSRTRFSQHLSVCLIDLQENELYYDESDPIVVENVGLFEPPIDAERVERCVETIRAEYVEDVTQNSVLLDDVVAEHDFDSHVTKRAFDRLERQGVAEQLYVDDLGLSLDVA